MLFKRRNREPFFKRLRVAVWPRSSWRRTIGYYIRRILRLSGSPRAVAAGFAAGVGVSFLPLFGLHFFLAFMIAFLLRGNLIASAMGTVLGNPITFPAMWALSAKAGYALLGTQNQPAPEQNIAPNFGFFDFFTEFSDFWTRRSEIFDALGDWFIAAMVGGAPVGLFGGVIAYFFMYGVVSWYQKRRRKRLARKIRAVQKRSVPAHHK